MDWLREKARQRFVRGRVKEKPECIWIKVELECIWIIVELECIWIRVE